MQRWVGDADCRRGPCAASNRGRSHGAVRHSILTRLAQSPCQLAPLRPRRRLSGAAAEPGMAYPAQVNSGLHCSPLHPLAPRRTPFPALGATTQGARCNALTTPNGPSLTMAVRRAHPVAASGRSEGRLNVSEPSRRPTSRTWARGTPAMHTIRRMVLASCRNAVRTVWLASSALRPPTIESQPARAEAMQRRPAGVVDAEM